MPRSNVTGRGDWRTSPGPDYPGPGWRLRERVLPHPLGEKIEHTYREDILCTVTHVFLYMDLSPDSSHGLRCKQGIVRNSVLAHPSMASMPRAMTAMRRVTASASVKFMK